VAAVTVVIAEVALAAPVATDAVALVATDAVALVATVVIAEVALVALVATDAVALVATAVALAHVGHARPALAAPVVAWASPMPRARPVRHARHVRRPLR
jgi:hypothetical protein